MSDYIIEYKMPIGWIWATIEEIIDGKNGYDQVEGYSISQIEQSVINQKTWIVWYNKIKNSYSNATKSKVPALFTHWY